ncbi:uncharacterized protein LOC122538872 [Frieseomelitta varia]|uniref:uncharacterized protein LOC122538872 n=1 Tax=Frieseomelitta varia TaxID=561572 RepID=UPI001CB682E6|nr:uncharacterized protein LOC122538872 [Frieseomelitta varia]XP_043529284.1 uncharacterized protein LOC122538872 [Frieseomelitta varia]
MDVGDLSSSAGLAGSGSIPVATGVGIITSTTSATAGWWTPTSTIATAAANTDVMNQLCRVCGEPAAGFHFGAFTCEGCKSFFGRTYNNLGSISECKNGGVCVINKKNRTACKACRLRKCLMVGMSKSGSRYGRRSNWFKIHCLLQEQSHQAQTRLIKDPKSAYEKAFGSLDVANNNNNNNNNENPPGATSATNVMGIVTTTTTTANSYHHHHHHHHHQHHHQDRFPKRDDLRPQDIPAQLRAPDIPTARVSQDPLLRPVDLVRAPHELLRPEVSRFPMWRGPPFFHPALSHMQIINTPFFPFQQRFILPYVNQVGTPPMIASLTSSSSDSVSPRSTPSPKRDDDNGSGNRDECRGADGSCGQKNQIEAYDKSLAFLRSLGPEQEEPIDLSMKPGTKLDGLEGTDATGGGSTEEERSTDSEDNELLQDTGPPLDLTRKT